MLRNEDPEIQRIVDGINRSRQRARRRLEREQQLLGQGDRVTLGEVLIILFLAIGCAVAWGWIWQHDAASHRALEAQGEDRWHETP